MPIILATWEVDIRRVTVQANNSRDPVSKKTHHKKGFGRVAQIL
jgi:hypothetical protein